MNILTQIARDGKTLDSWLSGGINRQLDSPTPPMFYSLASRVGGIYDPRALMSDIQTKVPLWRMEFDNVYDQRRGRDDDTLEGNIPHIQLLTMLHGFTQRDTDCSLAAFDIEAAAKTGQFPVAARDPVTAISYAEPSTKSHKGKEEVLTGDELSIFDGFCDLVLTRNVDCLITYNGARFDWKYMTDRGHEQGVWMPLGRHNDAPRIREIDRFYGRMRGRDYEIRLDGRLVFDVYKEVRVDTAIQGRVPNKQLKTIATYFRDPSRGVIPEDYPIIKLSYAQQRAASKKDLASYCLSDSRLTAALGEYYMRTLKDLAVYLKAPLNLLVDRTPSHIGNYISGRAFKQMGVVSDGSNYDRFTGVLWE